MHSTMSASLIGHSGSSTFRLSTTAMSMSLAGSCFSSESAPGPFHHGIRRRGGTIFWSTLPSIERQDQADMRTHLIHHPARTSFHYSVDLEFSPIGFDPERFSCGCHGLLPGPAELSAVNPDAVHDHGQPACQGHDRLFHPAAPGDLHGPWRDRSAPPRGRHPGSSSGAGTPHRLARWPASGGAG
jgi:hypothetical protein